MHISSPHEFMAIKAGEQKKKKQTFYGVSFYFSRAGRQTLRHLPPEGGCV